MGLTCQSAIKSFAANAMAIALYVFLHGKSVAIFRFRRERWGVTEERVSLSDFVQTSVPGRAIIVAGLSPENASENGTNA